MLLNPTGLSLLALALVPTAASAMTAALALVATSLLALSAERRLGARHAAWTYVPLELLRAIGLLVAWPWPFVAGRRVEWRGRRYLIGARTRLEAEPPKEITSLLEELRA